MDSLLAATCSKLELLANHSDESNKSDLFRNGNCNNSSSSTPVSPVAALASSSSCGRSDLCFHSNLSFLTGMKTAVQLANILPHTPQTAALDFSLSAAAAAVAAANELNGDSTTIDRSPVYASFNFNTEAKLVEYRGHQVAAFDFNNENMLCLPQAYEIFLKQHVGGLHTVYTKLKRLEINPVVCNVEQVRALRSLGAIQPGVNRCKLINEQDFDSLLADCTSASSRPGRPPKRSPVPRIYSPNSTLLSANEGSIKKSRLNSQDLSSLTSNCSAANVSDLKSMAAGFTSAVSSANVAAAAAAANFFSLASWPTAAAQQLLVQQMLAAKQLAFASPDVTAAAAQSLLNGQNIDQNEPIYLNKFGDLGKRNGHATQPMGNDSSDDEDEFVVDEEAETLSFDDEKKNSSDEMMHFNGVVNHNKQKSTHFNFDNNVDEAADLEKLCSLPDTTCDPFGTAGSAAHSSTSFSAHEAVLQQLQNHDSAATACQNGDNIDTDHLGYDTMSAAAAALLSAAAPSSIIEAQLIQVRQMLDMVLLTVRHHLARIDHEKSEEKACRAAIEKRLKDEQRKTAILNRKIQKFRVQHNKNAMQERLLKQFSGDSTIISNSSNGHQSSKMFDSKTLHAGHHQHQIIKNSLNASLNSKKAIEANMLEVK